MFITVNEKAPLDSRKIIGDETWKVGFFGGRGLQKKVKFTQHLRGLNILKYMYLLEVIDYIFTCTII